jgi:hypothetical protein
MSSRRLLAVLPIAAALFAAPAAHAAVPVAGGTTTLKPGKAVSVVLVSHGITLSRSSFPISGGSLTSGHAVGSISHRGTFQLRRGHTTFRATNLVVNLSSHGTVTGIVGGARVTLFALDLQHAKVSRNGFDTRISGIGVDITSTTAKLLKTTFSTGIFASGLKLGTLTMTTKPASVSISSGDTTLTLDPGTAGALTTLGVAVTPVSPSTGLVFPITTGALGLPSLTGQIAHHGGFQLANAAGATVKATDLTLETSGKSPILTARVGSGRIRLADLDLSQMHVSSQGRKIAISGIGAKLSADAADALNKTFGTTVFAAGTPLGALSVTATAT